MSPPCSNSHALKILLSRRGCKVCSTTLDTWGHVGLEGAARGGAEAGNGLGALLTSPCLAQRCPLRSEHQERYKMQNEGIAVWIPRIGEQGLVLGRMRGRDPSRCGKGVS